MSRTRNDGRCLSWSVWPTAGTSRSGRAMAVAADVAASTPDTCVGRVLSTVEWDALCASIGADPATGLPLLKGGGAA